MTVDTFALRANGGVGVNLASPTADLDLNGAVRLRGGSPYQNLLMAGLRRTK